MTPIHWYAAAPPQVNSHSPRATLFRNASVLVVHSRPEDTSDRLVAQNLLEPLRPKLILRANTRAVVVATNTRNSNFNKPNQCAWKIVGVRVPSVIGGRFLVFTGNRLYANVRVYAQ